MDTARPERSLSGLFSDLSQQAADLVRHEARLAQAEVSVKAAAVAKHVIRLVAAAAVGLAAMLAATAAVTLGLVEIGITPWVAASVTAASMALVAFVLGRSGLSALKGESLAPVDTMQSVKETMQWIRQEMR